MGIIEARLVDLESERIVFLMTLKQYLASHPGANFADVLEEMEETRGSARSIVIIKHNLTKEQAFIVEMMGDQEAWRSWLFHCFQSYCKQNEYELDGETCLAK
jgi:hypothetical protein